MTVQELINLLTLKVNRGEINPSMDILIEERDGENYCYDVSSHIEKKYVSEGISVELEDFKNLNFDEKEYYEQCVIIKLS